LFIKSKVEEVPEAFKEYIIAQDFGWTLDYIRSLSEKDKDTFFTLASTKIMYKNFDMMNMMAITSTGKSLI